MSPCSIDETRSAANSQRVGPRPCNPFLKIGYFVDVIPPAHLGTSHALEFRGWVIISICQDSAANINDLSPKFTIFTNGGNNELDGVGTG